MTFERSWALLLAILPVAWVVWEWRSSGRRLALLLKGATFLLIALALSQLGRRLRSYRRRERLGAIANALREELTAAPQAELRRAEAVLAYLHNMLAYTTLREESGLDGKEIGLGIGWAIRTLVDDLRRRYPRDQKENGV